MSARADGRSRGRLGVGRGLRRPPPSFPPAVRTFIVQVGSSEVQRRAWHTSHCEFNLPRGDRRSYLAEDPPSGHPSPLAAAKAHATRCRARIGES